MGLRKKIRRWMARRRAQNRLRHCRYVHLMFNDKFNKPFVDFLNRHFDPAEHLVLCKRRFGQYPFPEGANVVELDTYGGLDFALPNIRQVICHSLFDSEVMELLYDQKKVLSEKAWWIVWGGDFYQAPRDEKNDYVRGHFHGYYSGVDGRIVKERYHTVDNYVNAGYLFPIDNKILDAVSVDRNDPVDSADRKPLVQINNSCDHSTLGVLQDLFRFAGSIRVRVIDSYGELQYKDAIRNMGRKLFNDDFESIDTYMSPGVYAKKLAEIDVLVLAQNRQQGFGNTLAAMYLKKKVYIRSDVSTFAFLQENGVLVGDTCRIPSQELKEFLAVDEDNMIRARDFAFSRLDEDETARRYSDVFALK